MATAMEERTTDTDDLVSLLQQHCMVVSLNVSWPKLANQIDNSEVVVRVNEEDIPVDKSDRTAPQWVLLPAEWKKKFQKLESKSRTALSSVSIDMTGVGLHIVPAGRAEQLFRQLTELRDELYREADAFAEVYPGILSELRIKHGPDLFKRIERKLPSPEEVRRKFRIRWAVVTLGDTEHDSITDSDMLREAKQQMRSLVAETVEEMARQPRQEIAEAIDHLTNQIREQKMIRQGTLNGVRKAFDRLRAFDFLADSELLREVDAAEQMLNAYQPSDLNSNNALGQKLTEALQVTRRLATNDMEAANSVRKFRRILND